jgi:hypothetical protein
LISLSLFGNIKNSEIVDYWFYCETLNSFEFYFHLWGENFNKTTQSEFIDKIQEENGNNLDFEFYLQVISNILQFPIIIYSFQEDNLCFLPRKENFTKKHPLVFLKDGKQIYSVISEKFHVWMFPESKTHENWNNFTIFNHPKFVSLKESQNFLIPLEKSGNKRKRTQETNKQISRKFQKKQPIKNLPENCEELNIQTFESFFVTEIEPEKLIFQETENQDKENFSIVEFLGNLKTHLVENSCENIEFQSFSQGCTIEETKKLFQKVKTIGASKMNISIEFGIYLNFLFENDWINCQNSNDRELILAEHGFCKLRQAYYYLNLSHLAKFTKFRNLDFPVNKLSKRSKEIVQYLKENEDESNFWQ